MGTIATAIQQFVAKLKADEPTENPPEWYTSLDDAAAAYVAELPALTSSGDTLHTLAARNANDGDVTLNAHKLTNVADGAAATDAVTLEQLQAVTKGLAAGAGVAGTATLASGTVTVATTSVHTASIIIVTRKTPSGTLGNLNVGTITDATSFVIHSDQATEASTVFWFIVNPT